ncbi:CYTH domain-containing protein [Alkalihalobacillus pseudalcaliphilus]|uniref:CYTH domain-containing protein n=1 Tax=Alkalihalobacillus pseudalcaliphilus TaxID=79884 RepID=UPI00064D9BD8|nr:CYTH domain-containing protein [Alkalihalobacillus pseudalcaliphilus]KMK77304.1 hypothetical protein AB990_07085 [Alkalihalobacillus pseudalcaliphilus]
MTKEIEIESKSMLSLNDYHQLINHFQLHQQQGFLQQNHYFETKDMQLKVHHCALRVRKKNEQYTLTLKQPQKEGLLETNQIITGSDLVTFQTTGTLPSGEVQQQLQDSALHTDTFIYLGCLETERHELTYEQGLLCLDKSSYLGKTDYEVEFEGHSEAHAEATMAHLLQTLQIENKKSKNKVQRFFERSLEI